ncbi:MAG: prepilin-type N-terminal cleavage/methylation domain-containing protein [bacterium]|nr:prepilin-type N-terminal cleavage/methylation domain-containing protein [bacterium]
MRNARPAGFSLFEILIAVAIVAILAVAVGIPVAKNLNQGKVARAQSDAKVIGNAILDFYKDVGQWPAQTDLDSNPEAFRLVGNYELGSGNEGISRGTDLATGSNTWASYGTPTTLTEQLIRNQSGNIHPLYNLSDKPHVSPGWNGPYIDQIPLDPWGRPYVVNIGYALPAVSGTITQENEYHNVMVLSAGKDGVFNTTFDARVYNEKADGDDVGFVILGARKFKRNQD